MRIRIVNAVLCLAACGPGMLGAQSAAWQPPMTPWGHPDLQGTYTTDDLQGVPFQRAAEFGTRRLLTDTEIAERAASVDRQNDAIETGERPQEGFWARAKELNKVEGEAVPPNFVEYARRASPLSSLVSDPPDGRIPPVVPEARERRPGGSYLGDRPQSYLDMTIYDRCITRGVTAGFFPSIYGNGSQFVQTKDLVAIRYEMIHETRLIPLDDRPRSNIRSYMGESRGRWEGSTLVVETKNFIGGVLAIQGQAYSEDLVLTERFTRIAPDLIEYSVTMNDPKTWTAPWTATFPLRQEPGYEVYEYACHEGNYSMRHRLSAARAIEAKEATAQSAGRMKSLSHAIHAVNDLDTTLAFYREVFGIDGKVQDFANPAVPLLTNAPGVTLRLSMVGLPGGARFEFTHFQGLERQPGIASYTDPGAASLDLYVRDIAAESPAAPQCVSSGTQSLLDSMLASERNSKAMAVRRSGLVCMRRARNSTRPRQPLPGR